MDLLVYFLLFTTYFQCQYKILMVDGIKDNQGTFGRLVAKNRVLDDMAFLVKMVHSQVECQLFCNRYQSCLSYAVQGLNNVDLQCQLFDNIAESTGNNLVELSDSFYYEIVQVFPKTFPNISSNESPNQKESSIISSQPPNPTFIYGTSSSTNSLPSEDQITLHSSRTAAAHNELFPSTYSEFSSNTQLHPTSSIAPNVITEVNRSKVNKRTISSSQSSLPQGANISLDNEISYPTLSSSSYTEKLTPPLTTDTTGSYGITKQSSRFSKLDDIPSSIQLSHLPASSQRESSSMHLRSNTSIPKLDSNISNIIVNSGTSSPFLQTSQSEPISPITLVKDSFQDKTEKKTSSRALLLSSMETTKCPETASVTMETRPIKPDSINSHNTSALSAIIRAETTQGKTDKSSSFTTRFTGHSTGKSSSTLHTTSRYASQTTKQPPTAHAPPSAAPAPTHEMVKREVKKNALSDLFAYYFGNLSRRKDVK
uniref:Apple domain-containing protein n=1 Tax=Clytia hemisphaerica TaxID=252671 RepID=A0A7M5TUB9_9CNID